jgi:hypothetical protein
MSHWNLYWIETGELEEDCFIVAKNSRSACCIECNINDFEPEDVKATRITRIPKSVENYYIKQKQYKKKPWPWYVFDKKLFKKLGAQFREIDNNEEMLLEDVVYQYFPDCIIRQRSVGRKAIAEFKAVLDKTGYEGKYDDEDTWEESAINLMTLMGILLVRCQQIEQYIAHSFILGFSEKQKRKYKTINELTDAWKKKTIGSLLLCIEEAYDIEPTIHASFKVFLSMRNTLIYDIAVCSKYDINTSWGREELVSFLNVFDFYSLMVKKAFRSSFYASIDFGSRYFQTNIPKELRLTPEQDKEIDRFVHYFTPKV